jgi:beta-lactam-binding protein with PASTA domain
MSLLKFVISKSFLKQLAYAFVLVIVLIFLLAKWLDHSTNHDQKIQVPDLSKLSVTEAVSVLKELDLRLEVIDSSNYNPDFPPSSIIEQTPEYGEFVKEKRRIYLKINRATYKDLNMPDILQETRRNAEVTLKAIGFRVGENPVYIEDIAKDVVRGIFYKDKEIRVGDKLPKNSLVELKLGDGNGKAK